MVKEQRNATNGSRQQVELEMVAVTLLSREADQTRTMDGFQAVHGLFFS
jgi:hypothetical protein